MNRNFWSRCYAINSALKNRREKIKSHLNREINKNAVADTGIVKPAKKTRGLFKSAGNAGTPDAAGAPVKQRDKKPEYGAGNAGRVNGMKNNLFINRELSWLKFNERVLNEAGNPRVPLAQRLSFVSIFQTNLDEFFRVRVGTLMDQMRSGDKERENKTNMTAKEQIKAILKSAKKLCKKQERIYEQLMGELEPEGVRLINFNRLSNKEAELLEAYFDNEVAPFLTPMIVAKQQPFPFLRNGEIYVLVRMKTAAGKTKTGIIPCSNTVFKRLIEIQTRPGTFLLSEELILHFAGKVFDQYEIKESSLLRVTRNADLDEETAYDEELDFRTMMELLIKKRNRLSPVRLELSNEINEKVIKYFCGIMKLNKSYVFINSTPMDLSFVFQLQDYLRNKPELFYKNRSPRLPMDMNAKESMMAQIEEKDRLLSYPYQSIKPFIALLNEAAADDNVVSIKITLYRVANKSKIVDALIDAAENGKEVVVMLELRARFDEENNIEYSRKLERAGCRIIYGLEHYKVHSKLCLITKKTAEGVSYITQIGTGNYNEKTAELYTDLSLMTASFDIGKEAETIFRALLRGETVKRTEHLLVAPHCLQNKITEMIDGEINAAKNGSDAYIGVKTNALTDKVLIDKLIEASEAGVKIELIVRGICCLIPGVEGKTDNITVISIVGRFLEHSRIYRFGTPERDKIYISSADFMTRNTENRVEVAAPIYDEDIKARVRGMFDTMMRDDEKGKALNSQGKYEDRDLGGEKLNSQEYFYAEAYGETESGC